MRFSFTRFVALLEKECRQIARDRSVFIISFVLPVVMLFLYGFSVSMDMRSIPIDIVAQERTPAVEKLLTDFTANDHFRATLSMSLVESEKRFAARDIEAILYIPAGTTEKLARGGADLGLVVYGVDSNSALLFKNYAQGVLQTTAAKAAERSGAHSGVRRDAVPVLSLTTRNWFNEAAISTWYLVPGLLVVVTAVAACFMSSLVIAREWERGTMTSILASPASPAELLAAKYLPYVTLAMGGFTLSLVLAKLLFDVPIRGSVAALFGIGFLFATWATLTGIFLSAKTKSQFLASEGAILLTFLPTLMLSGFLFDLRSVPWWIEAIGRVLPPTYAVDSFRILFLSDGRASTLLGNAAVLVVWDIFLTVVCLRLLRKRPKTVEKKEAARATMAGREGGVV